MQRIWWKLPAIGMLILTAGCNTDNSTNPTAVVENNVTIQAPSETIIAPAESEAIVPLAAQVTNSEGKGVAGATVTFGLSLGTGSFSPAGPTSDAAGMVRCDLHLILPTGQKSVTITAITAGGSSTAKLSVTGTGYPAALTLTTVSPRVYVARGESARMTMLVTASDSGGVALATVPIRYRLVQTGLTPTFGVLSGPIVTDKNGSVEITLDSRTGFGLEIVDVVTDYHYGSAQFVEATLPVEVAPLENQVADLKVSAAPNYFFIMGDSMVQSDVVAQVSGAYRDPLQGVMVRFATRYGVIPPSAVTDKDGLAHATWTNNLLGGVDTVSIIIPGTGFEASTHINVSRADFSATLNLTTNRDFKYADGGLTLIYLTALLKDQDNQALAGVPITFHTAFGAVNSPVITDTLGMARADFTDLGLPSDGPFWLYARYRPLNLVDSVRINILPRNPVAQITLQSTKNQMQAAGSDSASIRATCLLQNGAFAPNGTTVRFEVRAANGRFTQDAVPVAYFGVAETYYIPGPLVGQAILRAKVFNQGGSPDSIVVSNEVAISLLPSPPSFIRLVANPTELNAGEFGARSTITAIVQDTSGNAVSAGQTVQFTTTKGNVIPEAQTDNNGQALSSLIPGGEAGYATVTGTVSTWWGSISGSCTVTLQGGTPDVITLTADPTEIGLGNAGEIHSSTLTATLFDAFHNLVTQPTWVAFELINSPDPPLGPNINNHHLDSARTENGIAHVILNPGTQIGGILVRAYAFRDPAGSPGPDSIPRTDTVSVINSQVSMVAGPPFNLDLDVDSRGEDAGGGLWEVEVSARVWDIHRNPVNAGYPVTFTVSPQIATIDNGATGNVSRNGRSSAGSAYALMRYNSNETFSAITIHAEIQTPEGLIENDLAYTLPLQRGRIILAADPGNWMFDRQRPNDTCVVRVWGTVRDGHDVLINNAPVNFTTERARFYWKNFGRNQQMTPFFPNPAQKLTGVQDNNNNEDPGVATVYLRGVMSDFYLDDFTLEFGVRVQAAVNGYDDAVSEPITIQLSRH